MSEIQQADVIIVGGGAAGLMCAAVAAARGRRTILFEHNERIGRKIEISGGGRCNFTNLNASPDRYLSECPAFCRSALARYTPRDFLALVEKHRIPFYEKKLGQLFCKGSSREIIRMLEEECREAGAEIRCGVKVLEVSKSLKFRLRTSSATWECDSLVVATGGLSFPKLGATSWGHQVAGSFGLKVTELRPGLVPLTCDRRFLDAFAPLSGVSLPVKARSGSTVFEEALLVTHRGVSGPAVLQISSYSLPVGAPSFDLLPDTESGADFLSQRHSRKLPVNVLAEFWPRRFSEAWCAAEGFSVPLNEMKETEFRNLVERVHAWNPGVNGSESYPKAEVTVGGVDVRGLSSKTMEAREVPGLFFIGEVVDVTGWLGGYNFQWAWASGHAAGQSA